MKSFRQHLSELTASRSKKIISSRADHSVAWKKVYSATIVDAAETVDLKVTWRRGVDVKNDLNLKDTVKRQASKIDAKVLGLQVGFIPEWILDFTLDDKHGAQPYKQQVDGTWIPTSNLNRSSLALTVFGFVEDACKDFIRRYKPKTFSFASIADFSRIKLYDAVAERIKKAGYSLVKKEIQGKKAHNYLFTANA